MGFYVTLSDKISYSKEKSRTCIDFSMLTNLGTRLNFFQYLQLHLLGVTSTKLRSRPGWKGQLMFYAFKCPEHGIVENYLHGYSERLLCPLCEVKYENIEFADSDVLVIS